MGPFQETAVPFALYWNRMIRERLVLGFGTTLRNLSGFFSNDFFGVQKFEALLALKIQKITNALILLFEVASKHLYWCGNRRR